CRTPAAEDGERPASTRGTYVFEDCIGIAAISARVGGVDAACVFVGRTREGAAAAAFLGLGLLMSDHRLHVDLFLMRGHPLPSRSVDAVLGTGGEQEHEERGARYSGDQRFQFSVISNLFITRARGASAGRSASAARCRTPSPTLGSS